MNAHETVYTILDGELYKFEAKDFNPDINKVQNNKENTEMVLIDELKKLITKVENNKEQEMTEKIENEKADKRKLIDEIGGILKGKVDEELWRTIIGKAEKIAYDKIKSEKISRFLFDKIYFRPQAYFARY